jgi:hypothetical protein
MRWKASIAMGRRSTYEIVIDGDWMHLPRRGMHLACCDCGLVHDLAAKVEKGRILIRVVRHNRATAALRRPMKFTKDEDE